MKPPPWTVVAGYDPCRCAHVIDIEAHWYLQGPRGGIEVKVFVGDKQQADRQAFKRNKQPLWPDDKVQNRIVHRVSKPADPVCFLIEITARDLYLDFYHEPLSLEVLDDGGAAEAEELAVKRQLEELEKRYADEREQLRQRTDLSPQVIRKLEGHAMRVYERKLQKLMSDE